ncbi:MAG: hypothetical protein ACP5LZ_07915, partial [Fervidicoccaceae archaeon]
MNSDTAFTNYLSSKGFKIIIAMAKLPEYIRRNMSDLNSIEIKDFQQIYRKSLEYESDVKVIKELAIKYSSKFEKIEKILDNQGIKLAEINTGMDDLFIDLRKDLVSKVEWIIHLKEAGIEE